MSNNYYFSSKEKIHGLPHGFVFINYLTYGFSLKIYRLYSMQIPY